jgi:hypothetical protein
VLLDCQVTSERCVHNLTARYQKTNLASSAAYRFAISFRILEVSVFEGGASAASETVAVLHCSSLTITMATASTLDEMAKNRKQ